MLLVAEAGASGGAGRSCNAWRSEPRGRGGGINHGGLSTALPTWVAVGRGGGDEFLVVLMLLVRRSWQRVPGLLGVGGVVELQALPSRSRPNRSSRS